MLQSGQRGGSASLVCTSALGGMQHYSHTTIMILDLYNAINVDLRQPYDIDRDQVFNDLLSAPGMVKALALALRLQQRGLLFAGLPCSSYIFISSATHKRTITNPWGEEAWRFVKDGNCLGSRFALLVCVAIARGATWLVENPQSTRIFWLPPLKWLLQKRGLGGQAVRWWGPQH